MCAVARVGAARVPARRVDRRMSGALAQSGQDAAVGGQLMALPVDGGIGPPERTGLRLACPRAALRLPGRRRRMRNLADYLK